MDKSIEDYIINNKVCSDLIFRNWNEFLEILFDCGGCVNEILWFEYVKINKQKESLGCGGYIDNENLEYMWAETMLHTTGLTNKSFSEIKVYIEETINEYKPHNLIPCFFDITIYNC